MVAAFAIRWVRTYVARQSGAIVPGCERFVLAWIGVSSCDHRVTLWITGRRRRFDSPPNRRFYFRPASDARWGGDHVCIGGALTVVATMGTASPRRHQRGEFAGGFSDPADAEFLHFRDATNAAGAYL